MNIHLIFLNLVKNTVKENEKNRAIVEYALKESNKPIGIASYRMVKKLPKELKDKLPEPRQIVKLLEAVEIPNTD